MKAIIAASLFVAAFPLGVHACDKYVGRDAPSIALQENADSFTVSWERYSETYAKTITKPFGVLMEGAAKLNDPKADTHYITRDKLTGDVIFDSIVFIKDCD